MAVSDRISEAINAYLDRDNTKYAIMMDGAWGVGKTHFIINTLIPARATTRFTYVSLYGVRTLDEIETVMAHELGHHVHKDLTWGIIVQSVLTLLGLWLADRDFETATANA